MVKKTVDQKQEPLGFQTEIFPDEKVSVGIMPPKLCSLSTKMVVGLMSLGMPVATRSASAKGVSQRFDEYQRSQPDADTVILAAFKEYHDQPGTFSADE